MPAAEDIDPDYMSTPGRRSPKSQRWKSLSPFVLWSVILLAVAPTLHGLRYSSSLFGRAVVAESISSAAFAAANTDTTRGSDVKLKSRSGSPFAAASWIKERVRDGKRRLHMQMMSMAPETAVDGHRLENAPVPAAQRQFLINGWRWHTRAVLRDVSRFRRIAKLAADMDNSPDQEKTKQRQAAVDRVIKCYKFMWSFSFTKLHKCETSLFFPWLRDVLPDEAVGPLEEFDREREAVVRIGQQIGQLVEEAHRASISTNNNRGSPRAALLRCAELSEELATKTARLSRAQEAYIVPYTAAYVDSKEQGKFNDKVILSLGLVDSQVFLVSMYDTIKSDDQEYKTFRSQVPKFARALIPTWRRLLYSPRAGCLEENADAVPA